MRVTGLLSYGLQVPDLSTGHDFYSTFGLQVDERDNSLIVRCDGRSTDQTILTEGDSKELSFVTFSVESDSLTEWQKHVEGLGITLLDAPHDAVQGGLWLRDPDGVLVNLKDEQAAPPRATAESDRFNLGHRVDRVDRALWLDADAPARPLRLSHMLEFVSDLERAERFYTQVLGLQLSDRIRGMATFLNSGPGDHHVFGFIQSTHAGLHHSSWEVTGIDQMAVGARTMQDRGYQEGWGLGRHTLGSNLFHYIRDPWGSWIE